MMVDLRLYIQTGIARILGLGFAFMISMGLLYKFIRSPIRFIKSTFYTKRDVMPACLNDPSLGQHKYMHLEEVKLHYVISGDEGKPLMLLVHGFPEFWYCWKYQIREFKKDYRFIRDFVTMQIESILCQTDKSVSKYGTRTWLSKVVAVDMRGYADSDKPSGVENYYIYKLVADLQQLIKALDYESCVLVGHDWGGAVVWNFAITHPEMVDKLIVMNAPHPFTFRKYLMSNRSQFKKSWYMMFFQMPLIPELSISALDFEAFERMIKMIDDSATEEDLEAYKYAFSSKGALQCPINYYRATFRRPIKPTTKAMKKNDVPTLIVWGEPDMALNTELTELAREYVSDLTVKIIKDSNHFVQSKSPEATNKCMREFLSGK